MAMKAIIIEKYLHNLYKFMKQQRKHLIVLENIIF